ncbi:MAG: c-type cytochrome [Flavobacteriales bacterium]|nr:c-type cytochrome [Flavobacteriales bacterium]
MGAALVAAFVFDSCKSDPNSPGIEYMPDMYRSPSFETYGENLFYGDTVMSARLPASNTIPRGMDYLPYALPNSFDGYMASDSLKNPVANSPESIAKGKELYDRFCKHCHGKSGQGDGPIPTNSEYPPPPSYSKQLKDLSEGKMFHSITYGKNLMGAHASQLTKTERWTIIRYVQTLQNPAGSKKEAVADVSDKAAPVSEGKEG